MRKKIIKNLLVFILLAGGLLAARLVLAQDFGTNEVNTGLGGSLTTTDPRTIVGRIINIALGFLGVVAVGFIIYGGFIWMTSGGDEEKITKARKILKNGVIGLVIVLASWGIATFILSRLGGAMGTGGGSGCLDGETTSCGCNGYMSCSNGFWGGCVGSDCSGPDGGIRPTNCDSSPNTGCQAAEQICAPEDYCDTNDCGCKARGNLGDPCDTDLSNATCEPANNRCAQYLTCNPQTCACYGPPVITAISPVGGFCEENKNKSCVQDSDCATICNQDAPNGAPGNFITIFGKNFDAYAAGTSKVVFVGSGNPVDGRQPAELNSACLNSWNDNQIVIAIPAGVGSGPIKIINKDNLDDTTNNDYGPKLPDFQANNIVRPGLCALTPNYGALSSEVNYQGINLYLGEAYFGNYQNNVSGLMSNFNNPNGLLGISIVPNIKAGDSGSFAQNNLNGNQEKSNYLRFTKEPEPGEGPFISSFAPTSGNAGQYVTIRGQGFGGARGTNHVYFGNTEAAYDFPDMCLNSVWKDNQIIVKVPPGLADGQQTIKISLGAVTIDTQKLNPNTFEADKNLDLKSSLCKIEPISGPVATPISLWGEYFGRLNDEGLVKFNHDKNATGTIQHDGRADLINTTVPTGAITGPVRVIKNSDWGNELNFSIGECLVDTDCGTQVCCPRNTYKKGRCVDTLAKCFIDIPTSVLEWSFSTGFGTSTPNPYAYSCAGLANYYGTCQIGATCPNVPGTCSPYAGGGKKTVADCDYTCATVPGCNNLSPNNCSYNVDLDKCVKNGEGAVCDLEKTLTFGGKDYQAVCTLVKEAPEPNKYWEITTSSSCPDGWTRGSDDKCYDLSSSCQLCNLDFQCEKIIPTDLVGHCVSAKICPAGATCEDNPAVGEADKCIVIDQPTCDCCCTIGQDTRDCCAPLKCEGTCGQDTGKTQNITLGRCGGCKTAGTTFIERDAACYCMGHNGQFCDINNPDFPEGVCTDCSNLRNADCQAHSSVCCLDAKKTTATTDDVCRGGNGLLISDNPTSPEYGYCAYYNCSTTNPTECASTTPVKIGNYNSTSTCATGCPNTDPCPAFKTVADCKNDNRCCFDGKNTTHTKCRLGNPINIDPDDMNMNGWCAYYNCSNTDPTKCASTTPDPFGTYTSTSSCAHYCTNQRSGPGLSCASSTPSICDRSICNLDGFGCFTSDGLLSMTMSAGASGCGTCCCQPGATTTVNNIEYKDACAAIDPKLKCLAHKGNCTGDKRGLCCGCANDSECGSKEKIGCGSDTCCQARPEIASTSPEHLAAGVCRNAVIKVNFNQVMDVTSFNSNILLLEEREYGNGVCPPGTFVAKGDSITDLLKQKNKNWLARLAGRLTGRLFTVRAKLARLGSGPVLAGVPDPGKLYCAISGIVSGENIGGESPVSSLTFAPQKLLAGDTNYYLVVIGDVNLDSNSGVMSLAQIGFNGKGYFDPTANNNAGVYVTGDLIKFNNKSYKNSQIIKFTTLSDKGQMAGICAIDHVTISPASYLFKTTANSLDENDSNPNNKTFDTKADRDKVFAAWAYSADSQILQPVTGYFWDWNFTVNDPNIAAVKPRVDLPDLSANKAFVTAQSSVTDGETKITATIKMDRFLKDKSCTEGNCSCNETNCSNNCCNVYSGGDGFNNSGDIYVFICNNPWPPIGADGQWSPWVDTCQGVISGACADYNYKFYYCRDAGAADTTDDLPAILNQAVIRGLSSNFICSADRTPCSNLNTPCGLDKNGDGYPDGLCVWNVLKESYFFREAVLSGGEIIAATDQQTSGEVKLDWRSAASQVDSYKIYYLKSGKGTMLTKEVKPDDLVDGAKACALNEAKTVYTCSTIVGGLSNNVPYVFKVSVISVNKTESELSSELTATPTDKTPPAVPKGLKAEIKDKKLVVSWTANAESVSFYRLYHGLYSLKYGESFDSEKNANQMGFTTDAFSIGDHYLALSAVDDSGNESAKSLEFNFIKTSCATEEKPNCFDFNFFETILTNIDFEKIGANGLPQDWSVSYQSHSLVRASQAEHLSGQQSVLLHQDFGYDWPGVCSKQQCQTSGACSWNQTTNTCSFGGRDYCHDNAAVYSAGQSFCWPNTNNVMWLRLAYNLANLDFKIGSRYAVNFYYKGKAASGVAVGLASNLGWSSFCVDYSYPGALKSKYSWQNGVVTPTPPAGEDPCSGSYGPTCSEQPNYCCAQAPFQKKCYVGNYLPSITAGNYSDWTWYYYQFEYTSENASWLDSAGRKLIEIGASIGYNSTMNGGTDLYIDDFTVKRIATTSEVSF